MVKLHADLIGELYRAMRARQLIYPQKAEEFVLLEGEPPSASVEDLLQEVTRLQEKRIEGHVEITPGRCVSVWSTLIRLANIVACQTWKGFEHANALRDVIHHPRIDDAIAFLPNIIALDRAWRVVSYENAKRIADQLGEFSRRDTGPYNKESLETLEELTHAWVSHKTPRIG